MFPIIGDVVIRTNGGDLIVNAPLDSVNHYGHGVLLTIKDIKPASYHEYGKFPMAVLENGRIETLENGYIDTIIVKNDTATVYSVEKKDQSTINHIIFTNKDTADTDNIVASNTDINTTENGVVLEEPEAICEGKMYEKLSEAIDSATSGATVYAKKNISITSTIVLKDKNLNIDFCGNKLSGTCNPIINILENCIVKLSNGEIETTGSQQSNIQISTSDDLLKEGNSIITIEGMTINSTYGGIMSFASSNQIIISNSTIGGAGFFSLYHNGTYSPSIFTIKNSHLLYGTFISGTAGDELTQLIANDSSFDDDVEVKHCNVEMTNCTLTDNSSSAMTQYYGNGNTAMGFPFATSSNGGSMGAESATGTCKFTNCTFNTKHTSYKNLGNGKTIQTDCRIYNRGATVIVDGVVYPATPEE